MSSDNSSTLKSYVDSASGMVQQGIASVTGSAGDQANADKAKAKADAESAASHTAVRAGGVTVSSTGAPAVDNADRSQGSWDQTVGSGKQMLGGLVGSEDLKAQGREQNLAGQQLEAKGQVSDMGQGVSDRVQGAVGGAVAGLTGDKAGQEKYADMHDEGKTRQRGVELDLQKKAEAEQK